MGIGRSRTIVLLTFSDSGNMYNVHIFSDSGNMYRGNNFRHVQWTRYMEISLVCIPIQQCIGVMHIDEAALLPTMSRGQLTLLNVAESRILDETVVKIAECCKEEVSVYLHFARHLYFIHVLIWCLYLDVSSFYFFCLQKLVSLYMKNAFNSFIDISIFLQIM